MRLQALGSLGVLLLVCITWTLLQSKPNVVIFFTDDQGTLDAGCYGAPYLKTPHIDQLAETGVRFTQAYAHTVCCPSRAMLMTGRHPQRGGVNHWTQGNMNTPKGRNMALEELTMAEVLKSAGYRTALFGKWHLGAHREHGPKKQGFDEFFGIRDGFIDNFNHYFLHGTGFHDLYEGTLPVKAPGKYFPELMTERSLAFIEECKDEPFFLYFPLNIPHYPEQAPQKFAGPFKDMTDPERKSYATIMYATDYYIGRIVDRIEELGLREDTIIIFMSDNGHSEEINNRISVDNHLSGHPKGHFYGASGGGYTGKWTGQKGTFFEGGIRVPAILRYPSKIPQGETRNQIITAMDWLPTVMDLCGIKKQAGDPRLDGHSLLPVIKNPYQMSGYQKILNFQWHKSWAVRMDEWKLIGREGSEKFQLYRLTGPEPERKNYSSERKDIVEGMLALRKAWLDDLNKTK
ncbi:sulfatase-like hydrolase/transferase [Opitutales bacterium]|nr:sulfatase-like hydrolase/transferase [Opitutales bacterium]